MKEKNLKKNLSWNTIGMVMYNFAIWLLSALILRLLGATDSGYYAIATSIGNTIYAFALFGMRTFIVADHEHEFTFDEYITARLIAIMTGALGILVIVAVGGYDAYQNWILILYSVFKLIEAMTELMDCFAQQKMIMDINAKSMIIRSAAYIISFTAAVLITHSMITGFMCLIAFAAVVLVLYNVPNVKKIAGFTGALTLNGHVRQILWKCFPIMVFEMLASLVVAIPRLAYERIGSLEALGIYNSIYTMVVFLQLVINVLIYTFAPYMAKAHHEKDRRSFVKFTVILFAGAVGLSLAAELMVKFLGYFVMGLLYGKDAAPYYTYLYLGIISGASLAVTWIFSQLFVIYGKTEANLVCSVISAIGCLILSGIIVNAADCNSITITLILTNLIFIIMACIMLFTGKRKGAYL